MGGASLSEGNYSSENLTNLTSDVQKWSFEFTVTLSAILSLVDLCIIVGNSMVLLVIIRHRGMRTRTNLFLVNLAVADLLVGLCVVPFTITTLIENRWIFGNGSVCLFNGWMNSFCLISSIHTLMYISIHKYFSIVRPLSNPLKLSYIIGMMSAAWMWAGICSTMNVTGLIVEHKPGTSQCGPKYPNDPKTYVIHSIIQITVIVVPFVILVFCYIRMFQEIKGHSQRLRTNSTVAEDLILSQQKKVAVTLLIVLATFVIMALPYFAYANYTTVVKDKTHFSIYLNPLAYTFLFMSSMCNPIIYAFRSPAFREGYKEILCQTPNYVISDDSEQIPRSNRLSSLISTLRRGSTASRRNTLTSLYDVNPDPISPVEFGLRRKKKQKSLFRLLRSTRQSNAQSVIHRNGDVIIMKSGKIVSVRQGVQGRESSPFIDRLMKFKAETDAVKGLAAGLANPSKVLLGIMCDGPGGGEDKKDTDSGSDWSDEVFCSPGTTEFKKKRLNGVSSLPYSEVAHPDGENQNGIIRSTSLQNLDAKVTRVIDLLVPDTDVLNVSLKSGTEDISLQGIKSDIELNSETHHRGSPSAENLKDKKTTTIIPTLLINISDDSEMLTVMPLTPNTRQYFTKSDHSLDQSHVQTITETAKHHLNTTNLSKTSQKSRSSEHIIRRKHSPFMRLPSVEYLDPPVSIFRSHSHQQMKAIPETEPNNIHQPGQTERRIRSKSPFFQSLSPFSRRKLTPDQSTHI